MIFDTYCNIVMLYVCKQMCYVDVCNRLFCDGDINSLGTMCIYDIDFMEYFTISRTYHLIQYCLYISISSCLIINSRYFNFTFYNPYSDIYIYLKYLV